MAYYFYLGKLLLPVPPAKLHIKVNNQNKTVTLVDGKEINILKKPKLTDLEFEALIPQVKYPFALYANGFQNASFYLGQFEKLKVKQEPFQFKVIRTLPGGSMSFDTDIKVSLEDYKIKEDKKEGFDLVLSINLKQYVEYGTKIVGEQVKRAGRKTSPTIGKKGTSQAVKTYTVKKGDTLWGISKKCYGDGSRYGEIAKSNKDKIQNPNLIYPGQILIIPKA